MTGSSTSCASCGGQCQGWPGCAQGGHSHQVHAGQDLEGEDPAGVPHLAPGGVHLARDMMEEQDRHGWPWLVEESGAAGVEDKKKRFFIYFIFFYLKRKGIVCKYMKS